MEPADETRRKNLITLVARYGGQRQLADRIRKAPAQLSQWINRAPTSTGKPRNISTNSAREIEGFLGLPAGWMDTPHDSGGQPANIVPALPASYRRLPVISSVRAGNWSSAADPFQPGDADEWREVFTKVGPCAFLLRVRGDSMTNPYGSPSAPEGSLIVVDPDVPAVHGRLVVAKLDTSEEATFKRLVIDGGQHYLKALNPDYKPIEINGNCRIVGVVVQILQDV